MHSPRQPLSFWKTNAAILQSTLCFKYRPSIAYDKFEFRFIHSGDLYSASSRDYYSEAKSSDRCGVYTDHSLRSAHLCSASSTQLLRCASDVKSLDHTEEIEAETQIRALSLHNGLDCGRFSCSKHDNRH